jgi:hypothetical protein
MISITDGGSLARALKLPIDFRLKRLLIERRNQLGFDFELSEMARVVIIQAGDSLQALERELGYSFFVNPVDGSRFGEPDFTPGWEWIADHGYCWELVWILDDAFGHIVLIQNSPMQNRLLRALCLTYASDKPPSDRPGEAP